jgi:malic enzyme
MPPTESSFDTVDKNAELRRAALEYHEFPTPGKIAIAATKQLVNQHDLALAYSPGVAAPAKRSSRTPPPPSATPRAATWWPSSPTARPCWAWATSARWRPSR